MDWAFIGVIALVMFDVFLVLYLNPKINRHYAMDLWNEKIPLKDLDGSVIKVPVRYQEGSEVKTKMEVAPLWFTIAYSLGNFGVEQLKLWIAQQKGGMARRLDAAAFEKIKKGELPAEMIIDVIPKKWQKYIAGYQMIQEIAHGNGSGGSAPQSSRGSSGSFKPGL